MNNKAFTLVELLASFTLTMIIVVFLFEIVLELKDVYINSNLKTIVMNKNAIIATKLNNAFKTKDLQGIACEDNYECQVYYSDGTNEKLNITAKSVTLGTSKVSMPDNTEIKDVTLLTPTTLLGENQLDSTKDNYYIKINYKVTSSYLNKDISFNYVYSFWTDSTAYEIQEE